MRTIIGAAAAAGLSIGAVGMAVGSDFGTKAEARALSAALVAIIDEQGIEAAARAVYDPAQPFVHTRMGVNLFQGSVVIADNQEPEMVAADYAETADLSGVPVWPRISAAAARAEDVILKWYHYDTQAVYDFACFARAASRDDGAVMVCR